jgi:phosphotransferase family enzyme
VKVMQTNLIDTIRVILVQPTTHDVLVSRQRASLTLPMLEIPRRIRQAEAITTGLHALLGLDAYCLFALPEERSRSTAWKYLVASPSSQTSAAAPQFDWLTVDSLALEGFQERSDWFAVKSAFEQIETYKQDRSRGFFGCPGWLSEITNWAQHAISSLGTHLTGPYQHLNASASSCLLRLLTADSAVWFKAVGDPAVRELSITRCLSRQFPAFLPEMIAEHNDSCGWLSEEVPGIHPDDASPGSTWIAAATGLAELQIASMGQTLHLGEAGCRDVRACALVDLVDPFFGVIADLMEMQPNPAPPRLSNAQLVELKSVLLDAIAYIAKLDIPSSLAHLDLNTGNILVSKDRVVFLDWASACIGSPFLSLEYLLEQLRTLRPSEQRLQRQVQTAYTEKWQTFVGKAEMSAALAANPLLAAFCYAAGSDAWRDPARISDPDTAGHLRSLSRRMKREAETWASAAGAHLACSPIR